MNKPYYRDNFQDSFGHQAAKGAEAYSNHSPVDAKIASACLQDGVRVLGDTTETTGACHLAPECKYINDKLSGVSGFCLKQVVGIETK